MYNMNLLTAEKILKKYTRNWTLHFFTRISAGNIFYLGLGASNPAGDAECQRNIIGVAKVEALPAMTTTIMAASALKCCSTEENTTKKKHQKWKNNLKPAVWRAGGEYLLVICMAAHTRIYACVFICAYLLNFNPLNFPMMTPLHFGRFNRRHEHTHTHTHLLALLLIIVVIIAFVCHFSQHIPIRICHAATLPQLLLLPYCLYGGFRFLVGSCVTVARHIVRYASILPQIFVCTAGHIFVSPNVRCIGCRAVGLCTLFVCIYAREGGSPVRLDVCAFIRFCLVERWKFTFW